MHTDLTLLNLILSLSWKAHVALVTGKLSKINRILNRLKYTYPAQILLTIYKSLFVLHISYGSLVWGQNCDSISTLQKKVIRTITHSNYIAHSESLLKDLIYQMLKSNGFKNNKIPS